MCAVKHEQKRGPNAPMLSSKDGGWYYICYDANQGNFLSSKELSGNSEGSVLYLQKFHIKLRNVEANTCNQKCY